MWLWENPFVLFVALSVAVKVNSANLTCFSSTLPAAQRIQRVFNLHHDENNLWVNTKNSPPPVCNFSSISSSFSSSSSSNDYPECLPCIDQPIKPETVYIFCDKLNGNENVRMESSVNSTDLQIEFNKTDCPAEPTSTPGGDTTNRNNETQSGQSRAPKIISIVVGVIICAIFGVVVFGVVYAVIKYRRAQPNGNHRNNGGLSGAENGTADGLLPETETRNGTANGHLHEADDQEEAV